MSGFAFSWIGSWHESKMVARDGVCRADTFLICNVPRVGYNTTTRQTL